MNIRPEINIRAANTEDQDFIVSLVPRLTEFGAPTWRDADRMTATDIEVLKESLNKPALGTAIFIAEDERKTKLGFIHLKTGSDYYNSEPHGHITDIIVAPAGEGRGIARRLMMQAEEWARDRGYRQLTLSVFADNHHAREIYKHLGYGEDMIKCIKQIVSTGELITIED